MWDKLAECTASTIDQFFTWKPTFFGPNPTFPTPPPLPPCNVVRKERLSDESSDIASGGGGGGGGGGEGGASEYCSNSGKRHFVPHILARIEDIQSAVTAQHDESKCSFRSSYSRLTSKLSQKTQYLASMLTDRFVKCLCRNISRAQGNGACSRGELLSRLSLSWHGHSDER